MGLVSCVGRGVCGPSSLTATTIPEETSDVRLLYIDSGLEEG